MDADEQTAAPSGTSIAESTFILIVFAIVFGWILVSLWQRFFENLAFGTLKLNPDSTFDSFIYAGVISIIFISTVWVIDRFASRTNGLEERISESLAL